MTERLRLGEILVKMDAITEDQLAAALAWRELSQPDERLGATIVKLGYISEEDVALALARQLGWEVVDLDAYDLDPAVTALIPNEVCQRCEVLPLRVEGFSLVVAMTDPSDIVLQDELRLRSGHRSIKPMVATPTAIKSALARMQPDGGGSRALVEELEDPAEIEAEAEENEDPDAPIIKLANQLLFDAHRLRASDVHVEPTRNGARVRVRIDGILQEIAQIPMGARRSLTSRLKIMGGMDIAERRLPQDGRARLKFSGDEVDIRMSSMPSMHGETLVMRLLHRRAEGTSIEDLGLPPDLERTFRRALDQPQGIVLVTGPTGSGKTSTLYAGLTEVADEVRNVITLEDPVEYELHGVNQTQVNPRIGLTFASGMRTVLRQDPDVVMVGEIRDAETAALAVEASMTGHLVLSTLHTGDTIATVARLQELGVDRRLLGSSLQLVMSQRLVRVVCARCAEARDADPNTLDRLDAPADALHGVALRAGAGCQACAQTGFLGRRMVCEAVRFTASMGEMVTAGATERDLRSAARAAGMRTLREDELRLALAGVTTLEEVLRVTPEDPDLTGGDLLVSLRQDAETSGARDVQPAGVSQSSTR